MLWCTEAIYQMLPGVKSVTSGYAGGTKENPTYEVSTGATGMPRSCRIVFDPAQSLSRRFSIPSGKS